MQAPTLFISDLHLDAARPEITQHFLDFLADAGRRSAALYILGDLFEAWIGDDDPDPEMQRVQRALRTLTTGGVRCYIMHGNRDFLIGRRFTKNTGCTLLRDGALVDLYGRRALLLHGDTLCTDDHDYQRLRRIVRNPLVQLVVRSLSLTRRQKLAARMRAGSKQHIENSMSNRAAIMDVNAAAVTQAFIDSKVDLMIHGHTHRPAVHQHDAHGQPVTRIVLGDWYEQGSVLRVDERGFELLTLPRST